VIRLATRSAIQGCSHRRGRPSWDRLLKAWSGNCLTGPPRENKFVSMVARCWLRWITSVAAVLIFPGARVAVEAAHSHSHEHHASSDLPRDRAGDSIVLGTAQHDAAHSHVDLTAVTSRSSQLGVSDASAGVPSEVGVWVDTLAMRVRPRADPELPPARGSPPQPPTRGPPLS